MIVRNSAVFRDTTILELAEAIGATVVMRANVLFLFVYLFFIYLFIIFLFFRMLKSK
jgi:hypothetical protein